MICWSNVYDRIRLGLDAGCHILLIGKTEYAARKYCRTLLQILSEEGIESEIVHCSSSSSTESVIGGYALEKDDNDNPVPRFVASPFLNRIEEGGICVLQSMETMKSNVIERLNSVLELLPADGRTHIIRFDERRDKPEVILNSSFRVIATTSEKGLQSFSPALRNRFLEILIGDESSKNMNDDFEGHFQYDMISEEKEAYECMMRYSHDCNFFQKQHLLASLMFIRYMTKIPLSSTIVNSINEKRALSELKPLGLLSSPISSLFYSICKNKATALYGPRMCGKTYLTRKMISLTSIREHRILQVSTETDFVTLMGSTDIKGNFNAGVLMEAVENGYLVVFDNAENMSIELLEQLDTILDPFTHDFTYPISARHHIHPAFRALFIFTTRRETLTIPLPAFYETVQLHAITGSAAKYFIQNPFCKVLCDHMDSGEITFGEIMMVERINTMDSSKNAMLVTAALFADRPKKKEIFKAILDRHKSTLKSDDVSAARLILDSKEAVASESTMNIGSTRFSRGDLVVNSSIPFSSVKDADSAVKTALFTALLTNYSLLRAPLLLVGDPDVTSEVCRYLVPDALHMELSSSMEMSHIFGEVSVCHEEDIEYILRSVRTLNYNETPLQFYLDYLNYQLNDLKDQKNKPSGKERSGSPELDSSQKEEEKPSVIMYRPGPLLRAIMGDQSVILNNINLLSEHLRPRLYALLFNLGNNEFTLFENNTYHDRRIVGDRLNILTTCESLDINRVENKEAYLQVFCQSFSSNEINKYAFEYKDQYPLHVLRKADKMRGVFKNPHLFAPFYITYFQSEANKRQEMLEMVEKEESMKAFVNFLRITEEEAEVNDTSIMSGFFESTLLQKVTSALHAETNDPDKKKRMRSLLPTKTTLQLLTSVAIADFSHTPLILEGDPGVGKTVATENFFLCHDFVYKRISFSNSTTIDSIFGCYSLVDGSLQFKNGSITDLLVSGPPTGKRIALLLDEVNLAPCDVLEVLLSLVRAYCNHEPFQVPGSEAISIPEDMLLICCMNPAAMSANRSTLPRQFYSFCLHHRDIKYSIKELFLTATSILESVPGNSPAMTDTIMSLFKQSFLSSQKTSIPFSLRDVLKVQQICNANETISLQAALWLVFACRHEESERRIVEKILGQEEQKNVTIVKRDDHCVVTSFWEVVIPTTYNDCFHEWCFTTSELFTVFKLSLALLSKRAILVYGSSPSGKSYTISSIADMWGMKCRTVYLNHESTPDSFIGRSSLAVDEKGTNHIVFRAGPLLEAMENGQWIVIEDIHLANNDVMESLNSLCEENPTMKVVAGDEEWTYVSQKSSKPVGNEKQIHPDFRIFFTISENTLKHFTGPFLSRCVIIYSDPIASAKSIQEICYIVGKTGKPEWFGEKEEKQFRRCMRVINSGDEKSFSIEFGYEPLNNKRLVTFEIPHSIESDLEDLLESLAKMSEEKKFEVTRKVLLRICDSTPTSFNRNDVCQYLTRCRLFLDQSFLYYIIDVLTRFLDSKETFENCVIRNQNDDLASILHRWFILSDIHPPLYQKKKATDFCFSTSTPLMYFFDISQGCDYQLYLLHYICGRTVELIDSLEYDELKSLFESTFEYLDNVMNEELMITCTCAVDKIRIEYRSAKNKECDYRRASTLDNLTATRDIRTAIENEMEKLPESIQKCEGMKLISGFVTELESAVSKDYYKGNGDLENDQIQQYRFKDVLHGCGRNTTLQNNIKNAFKGHIDRRTFDALGMNQELDKEYHECEYKNPNQRMTAKVSHCLYKLMRFRCPAVILNEYHDVLKELQMDIVDVLRYFANYSAVKDSLIVLLNTLLCVYVRDLRWEPFVNDYHDYPFLMPCSQTKEAIIEAIDVLYDNDWFETQIKQVKERRSFKKKDDPFILIKDDLLRKLEGGQPKPIHLESVATLQALDSGNETLIAKLSYSKIGRVHSLWSCDIAADVGEGMEIPIRVLQYEAEFRSTLSTKEDELFSLVWSSFCKLSFDEKLQIVCPRKRSGLGEVVIDMYADEKLRYALEKSLGVVSSIDELVNQVCNIVNEETKRKEEEKKRNINLITKKLQMVKEGLLEEEKMLEKCKDNLKAKYSELAEKNNRESYQKSSAELSRNDTTIRAYAYLEAFNSLDVKLFDVFRPSSTSGDLMDGFTISSLKSEYITFGFQILLVSKNAECIKKKKKLKLTLIPPDGLEYLLNETKLEYSTSVLEPTPAGDYYMIVLPLAPWKWKIDAVGRVVSSNKEKETFSLRYYENNMKKIPNVKKGDDNSHPAYHNRVTYMNLLLFKAMLKQRDYTGFKYIVKGQPRDFFTYQCNHPHTSDWSSAVVSFNRCDDSRINTVVSIDPPSLLFSDCHLLCYEIKSEDQLVDRTTSLDFEMKGTIYRSDQYIRIPTDSTTRMQSTNDIANEDVEEYNRMLDERNGMSEEIRKMEMELKTAEEEMKALNSICSASQYFFPDIKKEFVTESSGDSISDSNVLNSVIVIIRKGKKVLMCLPQNDTFNLPVRYLGIHDARIDIRIIITHPSLQLIVKSKDPSIEAIADSSYVSLILKNGDEDTKTDDQLTRTVEIEASIVDGPRRKRLLRKSFFVVFTVKRQEFIRTSEPCFCNSTTLYPPKDCTELIIWKNGNPPPLCISKRSPKYNGISVKFGNSTGKEGPATVFTFKKSPSYWGSKWTISPFTPERALSNPVVLAEMVTVNTQDIIDKLKTKQISMFIQALNNLTLAFLSANQEEKEEIVSILTICMESKYLLPSIKRRTEDIRSVVIADSSPLQWSEKTTDKRILYEDKRIEETKEKINEEMKESGIRRKVVLESGVGDSSKEGYRLSDVVKSKVLATVNAVMIETGKAEEDKEKNKKETKDAKLIKENEERYRGENYMHFLAMMENKKMDELFKMIYNRRLKERFVAPTVAVSGITKESFKMKTSEIENKLLLPILTVSSQLVAAMASSSVLSKEIRSTVNVIIDTNCTHRKHKQRIRSIIASILVTVMKEIGVHFRLFVSCGRYQGVFIPTEDRSLTDIISFIFDTESIVKLPSTPLDMIVSDQFDEKDPIVIVGDGMSEQLMSSSQSVRAVFNSHRDHMYLMFVIGSGSEALSMSNQQTLEKLLKSNFGNEHVISLKKGDELMSHIDLLTQILFTSEPMAVRSCKTPTNVSSVADTLDENLDMTFTSNKSITFQSLITSEHKAEPVEVLDSDLTVTPDLQTALTMNKLNVKISPDNLFDALSSILFVPNKSTGHIPSTSGTSIHIPNYIKYLINKGSDDKIFKKLGSDKIRSYSASIVIDCSSLAFSPINQTQSLLTVLSLLRNISNLQLPCMDIWVDSSTMTRICTGLVSNDIWEPNVIFSLIAALRVPSHNTALTDCIRYASYTCNCRPFSSIMLILTNGVMCDKTREMIHSTVHSVEMSYIGIGLGQYLNGFDDLFPTMLWSANPLLLNQAIMNISNPSFKAETCYAVPEHTITSEMKEMKHIICYKEMVKDITAIESTYEIVLSKNRILDKTESGNMEVGEYNSSQNDLGEDGAFSEFTILFVILYLCRSDERDDDGKIQDEFITENVLRYGKDSDNPFSPVVKLGQQKDQRGNSIGKGFNILYAFDYKTAIDSLLRGSVRVVFITCSPGDGQFPSQGKSGKQDYCDSFLNCIHTFNENGGGVFWFLENVPYTYEADRYFKLHHGFEVVGDKENMIQGGHMMERIDKGELTPGHFRRIGSEMDFDHFSKLDFGIKEIYEGMTLCKLNEKKLKDIGFDVFAIESEGNDSIMVRNNDSVHTRGRMD